MSRRRTATLLALILAFSLLTPLRASANEPRKILTGWLPYWNLKTGLPNALSNWDLMKEVMPFWYTLKYDAKSAKAVVTDLFTPSNPGVPISSPLTALRSNGMAIIPTITDGTNKLVLSGLLSTAKGRTQVATAISDFVVANSYDGIDLDFEGFAFVDKAENFAKTEPRWVEFVKELSGLLKKNKKLLSISSPYINSPTDKPRGYWVYSWEKIAPYIDRLRIMTYDYSVAKPGPIGPIWWAEKTIQYAISVMPASKVYIGLPAYGRDWITKVDGVCPVEFAKLIVAGIKPAETGMENMQTAATTYNAIQTWDTKSAEVTYSYKKLYTGNTASGLATSCTASRTVWYQNAQSHIERTQLVAKYKLGGVSIWTLGIETPAGFAGIREVAKSIAPSKVLVLATTDKSEIQYGRSVVVNATYTFEDSLPASGLVVTIKGKSATDTEWRIFGTATTNEIGKISVPLLLGKSTAITLETEGTWERAASISPEIPIAIKPVLSVTAPATVKTDTEFVISGTLRPKESGKKISLVKIVGAQSQNLLSTTSDADGNFIFNLARESRGIFTYQIQIDGGVSSRIFSIIVR